MAGLHEKIDVSREKSFVHCNERPVREHEIRMVPEFFDKAENVVPAAAVEADNMVF